MTEKCEDEHGQYMPDAGSTHPVEPENYDACNAVLRHTWSRYGERRYCTGMAVSNFGDEANYEHPEFCKHHQSRAELMKRHEDALKTGAHAKSHEHQFQHLQPHEQLLANDLYKSLLAESTYDFDVEDVELEIGVEDDDFGGTEVDAIVLDHPVPTADESQPRSMRMTALWFAALDFIAMNSIREEQFRVAAEESYEGRSLAVGERTTKISGEDGPIEVTDEHHLNLPLSRLQKDYERHLDFGGVEHTEDDEGGVDDREWVVEVVGAEPAPQPEADTSDDASPLHDTVSEDGELTDLDFDEDGG